MPTPTATQTPTNTTQGSCVASNVNARSCLSFDALWKAHPLNWIPAEPHPFKKKKANSSPFDQLNPQAAFEPLYEDQCAIKMSIAFEDGGLPFGTFRGATETHMVHQLKRKVRGALRAEEVANWLVSALGQPKKYASTEALAAVSGRKGIIFFKDFWQRRLPNGGLEAMENRSGDHLDLWDGTSTPAVPAHVWTQPVSYFSKSKTVWFWELK